MWQPIETAPERENVLLRWEYDDADPIVRLGSLLWKPFRDDKPIFKMEIDYGDSGAWVFTDRDDAPAYWHSIPDFR